MIYLTSTIVIILVLALYSIAGIKRNKEEKEFKRNILAADVWQRFNIRGNKDV